MDNTELIELQKAFATQVFELLQQTHDRISLEQTKTTMMFNLLLSELENHNPNVRTEMQAVLDNITVELSENPLAVVSTQAIKEIIG